MRDPKPCPCCGSADVGGASGVVSCYSCGLRLECTNTDRAVALWNERCAPDDYVFVPVIALKYMRDHWLEAYNHFRTKMNEADDVIKAAQGVELAEGVMVDLSAQVPASTISKAEMVQVICVSEIFGLGTQDCPRRLIFKYFNPENGELLAVCDPSEGEPDYRLYPRVGCKEE